MLLKFVGYRNLRSVYVLAFLAFWIGISIFSPQVRANEDLEIEVQEFFIGYFEAARRYDLVKMMEHLSRAGLESNLRPIIRSPDDDSIKRSVRLLFNADFIFAGYCSFHILELEGHEDGARVRIWLERTIHRPGTGPIYDFFLINEYGDLRVDKTRIIRNEAKLNDSKVDIDLCDIPMNWNNPALLKPGESPEEQQRRLGIP